MAAISAIIPASSVLSIPTVSADVAEVLRAPATSRPFEDDSVN
jgi:hypothetical protein